MTIKKNLMLSVIGICLIGCATMVMAAHPWYPCAYPEPVAVSKKQCDRCEGRDYVNGLCVVSCGEVGKYGAHPDPCCAEFSADGCSCIKKHQCVIDRTCACKSLK